MADCDGRRTNWTAIISGLSLLVTVGTAAVVFGEMKGQVRQNSEAIKQLQADNRNNATMLGQINERTVRIETTLQILVPMPAKQGDKQ